MGCEKKRRYFAHVQCVHGCAWEECVLLKGTRLDRQNADGTRQCAIACTAWVLLHVLELVLQEQRDAVSQRNVGSCQASIRACACILQSSLVEAGSTWAVKGWEGGFKKERKRGQTLKACPLPKSEAEMARGQRFNQD